MLRAAQVAPSIAIAELKRSAEIMKSRIYVLIILLAFPVIAEAHQVGTSGSFLSGLGHPVLGLDHLLAMISVGILSAQLGGRAIWTIPSEFVGVMLIGALIGMNGIPFFSVELGIALSVLVLGVAIAAGNKFSEKLSMLAVGFFALFHGNAHGTEMPELVTPFIYAAGFLVGTGLIHIIGVIIGLGFKGSSSGSQLLRYAGAGIAGIGFHIIIVL